MKMHYPSLILVLVVAASTYAKPSTYDQRQTGDLNVQIHLKDLRVVALVDTEILEDYTDYNYSYDYSDFTIKPKPSTPSESTTTVTAWHIWPTNAPSSTPKPNGTEELSSNVTTSSEISDELSSDYNSTIASSSDDNSTVASSSDDNSTVASSSDDNSTITSSSDDNSTTATTSDENSAIVSSSRAESAASLGLAITKGPSDDVVRGHEMSRVKLRSQSRCQAGYHTDAKGRCKKGSRRRLSFLPLMMKMLPKRPDQRFS